MLTPDIRIFDNRDVLAEAAAGLIVEISIEALNQSGRFLIALSGGSTPEPLYRLLANEPYQDSLAWAQTVFFWGDERCVPPDDPGSNYGQARRLLLSHVPVRSDQIHRIRGELGPDDAAADYRDLLSELSEDGLKWPRFDLVLMGMGADGHIASLFPGRPTPIEDRLAAIAVSADYDGRPAERVSLTPPVFNSARNIVFLVSGQGKAGAVATVLHGQADPVRFPAARIRPESGRLIWMLDRPAASRLS